MATKLESDCPPSPQNESDDEEVTSPPPVLPAPNVAALLQRLKSTGAILKQPKKEYRCHTCDEDYKNWEELSNHLIKHVSLPSVVVDKLPSDDEDAPFDDEENWSEEEDCPATASPIKTPQKLDISEIMKKTGLSIKKPEQDANSTSALNKLSGLGFTIKKNSSPIKQEKSEGEDSNDVMQKLGKLGGIKLKLKSDGVGDSGSLFKVVNGLKDFKASDDEEEEGSANDDSKEMQDDELNEEGSDAEHNSSNDRQRNSESEEEIPLANSKIVNAIQNKLTPVKAKAEPETSPIKTQPAKPGRPAIKQTPKRGANLPIAARQPPPTQGADITTTSTAERRESQDNAENVTVKQEIDSGDTQNTSMPLFSGQIKSERQSPTPTSTPVISSVKTEPDSAPISGAQTQPLFQNADPNKTPLLPVTKQEVMTIIEINGDSNDEDDDCCVVSATPASDIKPIIPKTENVSSSFPPPAYSSSNSNAPRMLNSQLLDASTEKQHSFNWNQPDSKPAIDIIERSADDIFESLLSTKRENALSDASEYISLDTLGPQHSCEVCNTRYTSLSLLEEHKRMSGHSQSIVTPSMQSSMLPYNQSSSILSSLLPVVKLSGMGQSQGFTHQQNVMINIQAYPGAGGVMAPPSQQYNAYGQGQNMHSGFQQNPNMYSAQGQPMPGQYTGQMPAPGQNYMSPGYGDFQNQMSKQGYLGPEVMPNNQFSAASPLQSMQQAVYAQSPGMMTNQMGQMGPPVSAPGHPFMVTSGPGNIMRPPSTSNVRIQNVQTITPGQRVGQSIGNQEMPPPSQPILGQAMGSQMPSPGPLRMATGANITGGRPRMTNVRGTRPSLRPGVNLHGSVRGVKPNVRMPIKRPGGAPGGPTQKRRTDMLLPGKHDNEDCHVMAMQKQRDGLPLIQSVQGAKDKLNLGSQISVTKKVVNKEANAMANVLASRGIMIKQKQKSRSPSPERPLPHIPNLGAGMSIKHTSKSSSFSIPEAKVGGGMLSCKVCNKMFMSHSLLSVHMSNAHPHSKLNMFKCDECPASYPKTLQLQHHKRVFHNMNGANRELGIPVVDLSQEENLQRLSSLGIYSFIPLANREQPSGNFAIPIISVHNMQSGMTSSLQALGADGLLSLGPLKSLPNS